MVGRFKSIGEDEFRLVVEAAPSGMLIVDSEGAIVLVNTQVEQLFGYSREELIGQKVEVLVPQRFRERHPEHRESFGGDPKVRAMGHGRDLYGVRKDGSELPVEIGLNPIKSTEGTFVLASIVDITERRRAEEELLRAKEELEVRVHERTKELQERTTELVMLNNELGDARDEAQAASRLKSEFLANMSHEIRTPMNAIIGMCNVLLRTKLDSTQNQYASNIKDGAHALLNVINDILDFSKIEAGRLELEVVDFNAVKIIESVCELLATAARGRQISLLAHIDPRLPQTLRGDPERLRQVLLNLTANAIKFSERGEVIVRAELESIEDGFASVKFSVVDTGIGLSASEQERLFQPFVQADGSIRRRFGGTGLGLSISKRLVELMNGTIGVTSIKGEGSTFWFSIPLECRSDNPIAQINEQLRGIRVLVIDDEPNARGIVHDYIESWGMRDGVAATAKEGLKALRQAYVDGDPFQVAIIDFVMPGINGFDLGKDILEDPAIAATRLILLTGYDSPGLGLRALEVGFKAYLMKPVRQSQLLECIVKVLTGEEAIDKTAADASQPVQDPSPRTEVILIVEDYAINQQVAQLYLDALGFSSHIVSNGIEAVEASATHEYGVILMDCQMPEMDGFAATAAIRKAEQATNKHTPIIAMTAHAMSGDRERCLHAGMDDYISKPVDPDALRKVLEKWLPMLSPKRYNSQNSPVDLSMAHARYAGNATQLFEMYMDKCPREIEIVKQLVVQRDKQQLLDVAHGIKGISTTIFADGIKNTCTEIEASVFDHNWELTETLVQRLEKEYQELEAFLRQRK